MNVYIYTDSLITFISYSYPSNHFKIYFYFLFFSSDLISHNSFISLCPPFNNDDITKSPHPPKHHLANSNLVPELHPLFSFTLPPSPLIYQDLSLQMREMIEETFKQTNSMLYIKCSSTFSNTMHTQHWITQIKGSGS